MHVIANLLKEILHTAEHVNDIKLFKQKKLMSKPLKQPY